jgi:hypothetical protein
LRFLSAALRKKSLATNSSSSVNGAAGGLPNYTEQKKQTEGDITYQTMDRQTAQSMLE